MNTAWSESLHPSQWGFAKAEGSSAEGCVVVTGAVDSTDAGQVWLNIDEFPAHIQ